MTLEILFAIRNFAIHYIPPRPYSNRVAKRPYILPISLGIDMYNDNVNTKAYFADKLPC